jgi:RNA polymerase sigma-70 factor, ECF subfamily
VFQSFRPGRVDGGPILHAALLWGELIFLGITMSHDMHFDTLMDRLRTGDQAAASEIFERFARRLVGLARAQLGSHLKRKIDAEDVMQSVFKSFFHLHDQGRLEFADWDSLWSLLTLITLRKCGHKAEHFHAACRNVNREISPANSDEDACDRWQAIAREPTPDEAAVLSETVEQLFAGLEASDRLIVELRLQGCDTTDICRQSGRSERSVYRVLERVKRRLLDRQT